MQPNDRRMETEGRGSFEDAAQSNSRHAGGKLVRPDLRARCDELLRTLIVQSEAELRAKLAVLEDEATLRRFFVRSTIENVRRIDCMRKINPLVCFKAAESSPLLCKEWGIYAADEGLHSRLFARDAQYFGVSDEEIAKTPLFFSTELLCGYLYQTLEAEGALATVASAYYVESAAGLTQPTWLQLVEARFGSGATRGSRTHLALDERDGHIDVAWNMCMRLVHDERDEHRFVEHVRKLHGLFVAYTHEVLDAVRDRLELAAATVAVSAHGARS